MDHNFDNVINNLISNGWRLDERSPNFKLLEPPDGDLRKHFKMKWKEIIYKNKPLFIPDFALLEN